MINKSVFLFTFALLLSDVLPDQSPDHVDGRSRCQRHDALAVIGDGRYRDLPDVLTMVESGVPLAFTFWTGLLAPAGIPADVMTKLNTTLNEVLRNPDLKQSMAKLGLDPKPGSPKDFANFLDVERREWGNAVRTTGVKLD